MVAIEEYALAAGRMAIQLLLATGVFVTIVFVLYILAGVIGSLVYDPKKSDERAKHVKLAVTSIASESVRNALMNTLDHTAENFPEYDLYCVIDEGAELTDDLLERDDITVVIVPDSYECLAEAKGRAINYFIETEIEDDDENWYGFIDDDNMILDDRFLYEIPYYEERGYGAMNPILIPRPGRSLITYVADHIRLSDDMTVFRLFTGVVGTPYAGFHGELLCARGDLLSEITFNRPTIVEDFAFAMELAKRGWKTWQSGTYVSILSPHDLSAFFAQRRRWFSGIYAYLPKSPPITKAVVGSRTALWTLGITGNWLLFPIWISSWALELPTSLNYFVLLGGAIYATICLYGCYRLGGLKGIGMIFFIPVCALIEHLAPVYSYLSPNRDFIVIEK